MADPAQTPPVKPPAKPSDWSIKELYKKAWPIVKKYKVLWIFGIALGATQTSSRSNLDQKDIDSIQKLFESDQKSGGQGIGMVLGAATNTAADAIQAILSTIPAYFYIIAALEVLFFVLASIAISIVYQSWAEAGLLHGIQTAIANGNVTIRESSEKAFRNIKDIALVRIIPALIFVALVLVVLLIMAFNILGPFSGLLVFVGFIFFIITFILVYFSQIWAVRKIVIENLPAKQALREGYHITLKKFWSMLGLGIVNTLLGMVCMIALAIVLLGPAIGIIISLMGIFTQNPQIGIPMVVLASTFIVAFLIGSEAVGGILTSFVNTVWSLAYQNIKGKYDK